jgi:aminopeptidase N
VKKPYIGISPGTTIRRTEEGEYNVIETKIDKPVQFASLFGGKYYYGETERDGLTVRVLSYGQNDQMAFKKLANLAHQIIDYYEVFLGPFPFTEFNIIEVNEFPGGQAPPATMFITDAAFNPHEDLMNQAMSKHANHIFAHEIAHQWWGHAVKMPSGHEQWLTESFAEYSSALVMNKMKGRSFFKGMQNEWKSNANAATQQSSIAMANRLEGDPMVAGRARQSLVYDKGAYLLSQLHNELGDEKFLTFLKSYQKTFNFKFGTTAHVAGMLQFVTKNDYSKFFDENYWGTGMPK